MSHSRGDASAKTFANVWDAIEDTLEDAVTMTMRSNVMIAINDEVRGLEDHASTGRAPAWHHAAAPQ